MKRIFLGLSFFLCTLSFLCAQAGAAGSVISSATEFSIPVSPAFDLMGVNPSQVIKPSNIREFKVDWSFRSWRLRPNLALQAQPIWEIMYNNSDLRKYQKTNYLMRTLSTLDISAGTVEDDNLVRRVAVAAKINLYRQYDPLTNPQLFTDINTDFQREQSERMRQLNYLSTMIKYKKKQKGVVDALVIELDSLDSEFRNKEIEQKQKIGQIASNFLQNHWNASHIDLAYGRIYSYDKPKLDSLNLTAQAQSIWLNSSLGFGKKVLFTGLVRYIVQYKKAQELQEEKKGDIWSLGLNFRYGSSKFNFFTEYVFSNNPNDSIWSDNTLNITQVGKYSISYGGDWRINRNVMLTYGVRTDYTEEFKFKNLIPVAGISCMMR